MNEQSKSPEQIEQEILHTRADIDQTLDALQHKLSPGQVLDQALGYAKDGGGEFVANLGRSVRDNPLPLLLAGTGLAWLMVAGRSRPAEPGGYGARDYAGSDYASHERRAYGAPYDTHAEAKFGTHTSSYENSDLDTESRTRKVRETVGEKAAAVGEKLSGVATDTQQRAAELGGDARERAESLRHQAGDYLSQARNQGARAASATTRFFNDHPLVVGTIGLALGALIAASLPSSRREEAVFGSASDKTKRAARAAGREQLHKARGVAGAAVEAGKAEAERQDLTADAARQETERVAQAGADVVTSAARAGEAAAQGKSGAGTSETPKSAKRA